MKKIFALLLLVSAVALSGCSINLGFGGGASKGPDAGVFKSATKGASWQQKALIATVSGRPGTIAALDSTAIAMDPSDNKALYFAAAQNGLFYTLDGAESWQQSPTLHDTLISGIVVDPHAKCTIYASSLNKLLKSSDCARTWQQVYYDNELDVAVSAIAIDHYDSSIVYIGTTRGEVIQSSDAGTSWQTLTRFEDSVRKILISPDDSRIIFAATGERGLYRSNDKGTSWLSLADRMKDFQDTNRFRDLYVSALQPGMIIYATNYGLLKSINYGDDWMALKLITPEKEAVINSVIISEHDVKNIYYVTNTTFYSTIDGGENWTTKKLPSARPGRSLLGDPKDPNTLYLTVRQPL